MADISPESFYQPLFDAAGEGILLANRQGKILLANKRLHELFDYSPGSIVGESVHDLLPADLRNKHREHVDGYFSNPKPRAMGKGNTLSAVKKDGTTFPVEISLNYFETGGETYAIALVTDISQRRQAEQKIVQLNEELESRIKKRTSELAKSQQLYSTIARNFPDGTINVFDQDLNYVFAEGKELHKLGISSDSLVGSNYIERLPEEISKTVYEYLQKALNGEPCSFEISLNNSHYSIDAVPLPDQNGDTDQILVVEKNVTAQKQAADNMEKALQKEKELNQLKSRFVSMASHEFRTPLGTILSSAALIGKYKDADQQTARDKHISRIQSSVHNLTSILGDFLSLDRLETGGITPQPVDLDIHILCQEVIDDMSVQLKRNQQIQFTSSLKEQTVFLDKQMTTNILTNLLSNASKYSDEGTTIQLRISAQGKQLVIEIEDHGCGIPIAEQAHLFERFFRATNVTNIQGTGLGLNITQKYITLMEGTIQFKSVPNEGTCFTVRLPLQDTSND